MANWKKTNEAWFGDTLNRNATLCYLAEDGSERSINLNNCTVEYEPCGINADGNMVATFSADLASARDYAVAKGISGANYYNDVVIKSDIDVLKDQIIKLQEKIEKLKSCSTATSELRSALRTLNYKREVE